jgi:hypothetical protein
VDAQKLGIVALIVIVVLFAITLGVGASHDDSGDSDRPDPVEFLEGLKSDRFVEIGDKASTTCENPPGELIVAGTCAIAIDERGFLSKPTRVALHEPDALLTVQVEQDTGPSQDDVVAPGECFETAIAAKGGTVTLIALGAPVNVDLRAEQCPEEEEE